MAENEDSTAYVDSSGNLRLDVGANQRVFFVSSSAMCLASPVWRAMFNPQGHFLEAHSVEQKASFPEDDPTAFLLLLQIAHLQFSKIPKVLRTKQLFDIAVLCDKYDTVGLVRLWLQNWISNAQSTESEPGFEGEWLMIAWTFGKQDLFQRIMSRLSLQCSSLESGQLFTKDGTLIGGNLIPSIAGKHSSLFLKVRLNLR
ncbi:hypothetical protein MMC28_001606 [Mycoblastus sanguinarius]|nr:hypothetical protein [Mycoblastus sanguinarius]